jgi:hypothetical protein
MAERSEDGPRAAGGSLAGEPRDRAIAESARSLALTWLAWWIVLMAFWVVLDDSTRPDELVTGAAASALAALLPAAVIGPARLSWVHPRGVRLGGSRGARRAGSLPGQVARDTAALYQPRPERHRRGS